MIVIIGLGNPGDKYTHSRHNMGWRVIGELAVRQKLDLSLQKNLEAEVGEGTSAVLARPHTFMNLSGNAVKAILKKYDYGALGKKDFHNVFVVYDDLDLPVGKYKLVFGSGPKVHNGVNHIKEVLGTEQFWHVRIGVDGRNGDRSTDPQEYVLSGFNPEEQELLTKVVDSIVTLLGQKLDGSA